ncbi:MAG: molybdopterin cofactor-binding domain-containing protein, partial [Chloroflexota bacterium]
QAHQTVWAKLCADLLGGIDPGDCVVRQGDTDVIAEGWGTMASRSAVNAGNALLMAARDIRRNLDSLALRLAGVDGPAPTVNVEHGRWTVRLGDEVVAQYSLRDLARQVHPA